MMQANSSAASRQKQGNPAPRRKTNKEKKRAQHEQPVPLWLRLIFVGTLCLVAVLLGAVIGYGLIGDGYPLDALKFDTWRHIFDLVYEKV